MTLITIRTMKPNEAGLSGFLVSTLRHGNAYRHLKNAMPKFNSIPYAFPRGSVRTRKSFEAECVDYITKPISPSIVRARFSTHLSLYDQKKVQEEKVLQKTAELEKQPVGHS